MQGEAGKNRLGLPGRARRQMHLVTKNKPRACGSGRAQLWLGAGLMDQPLLAPEAGPSAGLCASGLG